MKTSRSAQVTVRDREVADAKEHADRLATALSLTASAYPRCIMGRSLYHFKIPMHSKQFYCFAYASQSGFGFSARCRVPVGDLRLFGVNLVTEHGFTRKCPRISKELGVPVFGNRIFTEKEIAESLLLPATVDILRKIDFVGVSYFTLSPIELILNAEQRSIEHTTEQIHLLRQLIAEVFKQAAGSSRVKRHAKK